MISICTEQTVMFWEGNWNNFLEYLGGPEKGLAGQRPALTGWLLRRLLLLRRCCSGDSEELRLLLLLRLLNDLCRCQIW